MDLFIERLKQEYLKRSERNSKYSLRSFASALKTNHATLSGQLSGKRKITKEAALKMTRNLGWDPSEVLVAFDGESYLKSADLSYKLLQNDVFASISEWYFDAILEYSKIPGVSLEPRTLAQVFSISVIQAQMALEVLLRLEFFDRDKNGTLILATSASDTSNILDPNFTSAAHVKYQSQILEKSMIALEETDRIKRDHTSTTIAINTQDLPQAKKMIQKFRRDLDKYLQRKTIKPDKVYQLQVSFFPISK